MPHISHSILIPRAWQPLPRLCARLQLQHASTYPPSALTNTPYHATPFTLHTLDSPLNTSRPTSFSGCRLWRWMK